MLNKNESIKTKTVTVVCNFASLEKSSVSMSARGLSQRKILIHERKKQKVTLVLCYWNFLCECYQESRLTFFYHILPLVW